NWRPSARPIDSSLRRSVSRSGSGWRPLRPSFGPARSKSWCRKKAPGKWPTDQAAGPLSGSVRSCRQSTTTQSSRRAANSSALISVVQGMGESPLRSPATGSGRRGVIGRSDRPQAAAQELVEVLHAVFHGALVRPRVVVAAIEQHPPARVHAQRDLVVLDGRLHVGGALDFDELALEQRDLFRVIEL